MNIKKAKFKKGDIWWVNFDPSMGGEIRKTRPAIIVSNTIVNQFLNRIQVVPITSQVTKIYPTEAYIEIKGKKHKAMADQIFTASLLRFKKFIATANPEDVLEVEKAIKFQLDLL